jgi:hypothetical protein
MKKITLLFTFLLLNTSSYSATWKKILTEDKITIYAKEGLNKIIPFKAVGDISGNIEEILAHLKNHSQKHLWSPKLRSVKIHRQLSENKYVFSEYYKTPWPAYDREFLLFGEVRAVGTKSYILEAQSIKDEKLADDDYVQADVKILKLILKKKSENLTQISFEFHGDMKGWMPAWLINIIQKKWPLRFIQGLRRFHAKSK